MFVALACTAFSLFAPTVLLPILREHCELLAEEARLKERVADIEREIRRRSKLARAFAHDTVINERLAMLDLHYRRPNEVILPVLAGGRTARAARHVESRTARSSLNLPDHWPHWARRTERRADEMGLVGLFLDPGLRPVFLLMSAGLVIAAFVLFAPKTTGGACPLRTQPAAKDATAAPLSV